MNAYINHPGLLNSIVKVRCYYTRVTRWSTQLFNSSIPIFSKSFWCLHVYGCTYTILSSLAGWLTTSILYYWTAFGYHAFGISAHLDRGYAVCNFSEVGRWSSSKQNIFLTNGMLVGFPFTSSSCWLKIKHTSITKMMQIFLRKRDSWNIHSYVR